jgi:alanine-alpha-ketoisovalerate/valine-pyruvate aminotransferase
MANMLVSSKTGSPCLKPNIIKQSSLFTIIQILIHRGIGIVFLWIDGKFCFSNIPITLQPIYQFSKISTN